MPRPTIGQIVPIDRRNHHMRKPETGHGGADISWLEGVERARLPGCHIAKSAGPGAERAHDHHGGVFLGPAFPDVGTGRFLAHRAQIVFADDLKRLAVGVRGRRLDPDPGRLALNRMVRLVRMFRVTGAAISR